MMRIFTQSRFGRLRMMVCLSVLMFYVGQCQNPIAAPLCGNHRKRHRAASLFFETAEQTSSKTPPTSEPLFQKLQLQHTSGDRNILHIHSRVLGKFLTRGDPQTPAIRLWRHRRRLSFHTAWRIPMAPGTTSSAPKAGGAATIASATRQRDAHRLQPELRSKPGRQNPR